MMGIYRGLTGILEPLAAPLLKLKAPGESPELHRERLGYGIPRATDLWCHAASLGEVAALAPIVKHLKNIHPNQRVSITTSTAPGRIRAQRLQGADVSLGPLDLPRGVERAFDIRNPRGVLLVETELWPNFICEAQKRSIPLGVVNGRISSRAWPRYWGTRWFWRPLMGALQGLAVRTTVDADRFVRLGAPPESIRVTGNTKHDGYETARPLSVPWSKKHVVTFASVHPQEAGILVPTLKTLLQEHSGLRIILVPRHLDTCGFWLRECKLAGLSVRLWSEGVGKEEQILLLDSYGLLAPAFASACLAFVGGSLAAIGGHNPMEAAAQGIPVVMGPHHHTVATEVEGLMRVGALRVQETSSSISATMGEWIRNPGDCSARGTKARDMVQENGGAVVKSVAWLMERGVVQRA